MLWSRLCLGLCAIIICLIVPSSTSPHNSTKSVFPEIGLRDHIYQTGSKSSNQLKNKMEATEISPSSLSEVHTTNGTATQQESMEEDAEVRLLKCVFSGNPFSLSRFKCKKTETCCYDEANLLPYCCESRRSCCTMGMGKRYGCRHDDGVCRIF